MRDISDNMKWYIAGLMILFFTLVGMRGNSVDAFAKTKCAKEGCKNTAASGSNYCYVHKPITAKNSRSSSSSVKKSTNSSTKQTGSSGKKYTTSKKNTSKKKDTYDVYSYKSAQDFADDKYEEFYDYEDDYEDEDEAYDAAVDYWNDHH